MGTLRKHILRGTLIHRGNLTLHGTLIPRGTLSRVAIAVNLDRAATDVTSIQRLW